MCLSRAAGKFAGRHDWRGVNPPKLEHDRNVPQSTCNASREDLGGEKITVDQEGTQRYVHTVV